MKKIIKIALVIGHTENGDKGAYSEFLKKTEYDYWLEVAKKIKSDSNVEIDIYDLYSHKIQDYYNRQKALADKINKGDVKYDLVLELHFNAASPLANGVECLHYFNSKKGLLVSQFISNYWSEKFGLSLRGNNGAKALVQKNDRGFYFTYLIKYPAVITELFFGSNKDECLKFKDTDLVAKELRNCILKMKLAQII